MDQNTGVPYRDGRGCHRRREREDGAWQETYDDYNPSRCECGGKVHWGVTGGLCLRCYARGRRS